jgi:hypothetical protein
MMSISPPLARPCGSKEKSKDRYLKEELVALARSSGVDPRQNIDQLCVSLGINPHQNRVSLPVKSCSSKARGDDRYTKEDLVNLAKARGLEVNGKTMDDLCVSLGIQGDLGVQVAPPSPIKPRSFSVSSSSRGSPNFPASVKDIRERLSQPGTPLSSKSNQQSRRPADTAVMNQIRDAGKQVQRIMEGETPGENRSLIPSTPVKPVRDYQRPSSPIPSARRALSFNSPSLESLYSSGQPYYYRSPVEEQNALSTPRLRPMGKQVQEVSEPRRQSARLAEQAKKKATEKAAEQAVEKPSKKNEKRLAARM